MTADRLTLAQIATSSLAAARTLERYDLDYCTGADRSLAEACQEKGIDGEAVAGELSIAADPPVDDRDWTTEPLPELLSFLVAEHAAIREDLSVLQNRLERVAASSTGIRPSS
jgi:regulator of cell morphogenesis and NO signaling